jgi:hypothetical protein
MRLGVFDQRFLRQRRFGDGAFDDAGGIVVPPTLSLSTDSVSAAVNYKF